MSKTEITKTDAELLVADALHSIQCTWNHTDGCAYYYGPAHRLDALERYIPKAKQMLRANDYETVISVLNSLRYSE